MIKTMVKKKVFYINEWHHCKSLHIVFSGNKKESTEIFVGKTSDSRTYQVQWWVSYRFEKKIIIKHNIRERKIINKFLQFTDYYFVLYKIMRLNFND